jgi:phospholipid-binding lipoprotein MlaA
VSPARPLASALLALVLLGALGGCATTASGGGTAAVVATNPADPWERWNRAVFGFNDAVDNAVLIPVATAYRDFVPQPVRTGVGNFFGNMTDLWSAANHLMQGKVEDGLLMGTRVMTNSVFGIGGLIDIAADMGLERQSEDFGQTLGVWGFGPGPYMVLPFLGPSTVRDALATPVDWYGTPPRWTDENVGYGLLVLKLVDIRAGLLTASRILDQIALDRYNFLRDAYLSRRRNQVYDGDPPELPEESGGSEEPLPPK